MTNNALVYPSSSTVINPVVIDLGKAKASKIKDLKRGGGKLMQEILEATEHAKASMGAASEQKEFVPVVLIYKKKRKNRLRNGFGF
jgi:hypothetical protein